METTLTERQQQIFELLNDLCNSARNGEVKTISPFFKKHNVLPVYGTIMLIYEIIYKSNGKYEWNDEKQVSNELAITIDNGLSLYQKKNRNLPSIKSSPESQNEFNIVINDWWEVMGFFTLGSAKRSLSRYCEINKDYIVNTDVNYSATKQAKKGNPEWSQEFLIMTIPAFQKWCIMCGLPMAKQIALNILEISKQHEKLLIDHKAKDFKQYLLQARITDYQQAVKLLNYESSICTQDLQNSISTPNQLVIDFPNEDPETRHLRLRQELLLLMDKEYSAEYTKLIGNNEELQLLERNSEENLD